MKKLFSLLFLTIFSVTSAFAACDSNTVLLLHMNGADASTTFTDSGPNNRTMTANGNAQIDTAQFQFGGASGLFDGTGDYVTGTTSSIYAFGTGDWTIDFWVRLNSTAQQGFVGLESTTNGIEVLMVDSTTIRVFVAGSAFNFTITTLSTGVWYHIAAVRSGTNLNVYRNGVQEGGTSTSSGSVSNSLGVWVGSRTDPVSETLNGWLDEVRISNSARWTGNFTPPTAEYCPSSKELALLGCG